MVIGRELKSLFAIFTGATLLTAGCSTSADPATEQHQPVTLTVMGAASTRVINDELTALAGALDQPISLQFNNAGSSSLVQQLHDGAPGDVFISADQKNMDKAIEQGSVSVSRVVATNSMVMVVPKGNPAGISGLEDLGRKSVVLCDVQVPCGTVSAKLEEANGLTIQAVSLEQSVTDVLGKVVSGEADAGWVYRTDAAAAGDSVEVISIPHAEEFPNSLVAGTVVSSTHPDQAQRILDLLSSSEMATVWRQHGFTPVGG